MLKARVIAIESGTSFLDGQRRVTLQFEGESTVRGSVVLREAALGLAQPLELDDWLGFIVAEARVADGLVRTGIIT